MDTLVFHTEYGYFEYDLINDSVTINSDTDIPFDEFMRLVRLFKKKVHMFKKEHMDINF